MPETFEYGYRLDPAESNFSSNLNLSASEPSLVTFRVFPGVDSGGTLSLMLSLHPPHELDRHATNVSIRAVLAFGSRPKLKPGSREWDWEDSFQVNSSLAEFSSAEVHIPYPESGLWYLGLLPLCYFDDRHNFSHPDWVPCELESISVGLMINSSACVNQKCGLFGRCFQYISGGVIFSSCYCSSGYRGWGCTDNRDARSHSILVTELLLLTLSNLFMLPAIVLAATRQFYLEALVYLATMVSSSLYHACDAELSVVCVLRPNVLQYSDFLTAVVSFWVTLLCLAELSTPVRTLVSTFGVLCIAIGVENDRTGILVIALPIGLGLTFVFFTWVRQCTLRRSCYPARKVWLMSILPSAVLAITGASLYVGLETRRNYAYVHSAWHVLVAISLFLVLPEKRKCLDTQRQDPVNTCSYVRVDELSDMTSTPELTSTRSHLMTPGPTAPVRT